MKTIAIKQSVSDRNRTCRASALWTHFERRRFVEYNSTKYHYVEGHFTLSACYPTSGARKRSTQRLIFVESFFENILSIDPVCKLSFRKKLHLVKNSGNFTFEARNIIFRIDGIYCMLKNTLRDIDACVIITDTCNIAKKLNWSSKAKIQWNSNWSKDMIISNFLN